MSRTVVLDCRWLTFTGAGRVVELLLRGFRQERPTDHWLLWGPPGVARVSWPGAPHIARDLRPNVWNGQRDWFAVPSGDLVVFMHQQRPLRRVPSLTTILDTTPLHFPAGALDRALKHVFLKQAAGMSRAILTISKFARDSIIADLGVEAERIEVLRLPADQELAGRVLASREQARRDGRGRDTALYLGLFLAHKNLPRLVEAFGRTEFCRQGGRLLLVGGKDLAGPFEAQLSDDQRRYVEVRARCSQAEVEDLLATARFLVQPSLVEGFGLPVWEALASGLPVCASDGGSLPEITYGLVDHFPARSVEAMTAAIDDCAKRSAAMRPGDDRALSQRLLAVAPTVGEFSAQFEGIVRRHLDELETEGAAKRVGWTARPARPSLLPHRR